MKHGSQPAHVTTPSRRGIRVLIFIAVLGTAVVSLAHFATTSRPYAKAQRQAPAVGADVTWIDAAPVPKTLRRMWEKSDLVVFGRVAATGEPVLRPKSASRLVVRLQTVQIAEVFKGRTLAPGPTITVLQYGGTIDVGGVETKTSYPARLLQTGEEVLLFLTKSHDLPYFEAFMGDASRLQVDSAAAVVSLPRSAGHVAEFRDRAAVPVAGLFEQLRQFRDGKVQSWQ